MPFDIILQSHHNDIRLEFVKIKDKNDENSDHSKYSGRYL